MQGVHFVTEQQDCRYRNNINIRSLQEGKILFQLVYFCLILTTASVNVTTGFRGGIYLCCYQFAAAIMLCNGKTRGCKNH